MSLEAMRYAVARLLTDPAYQRAFFADGPGNAGAHGLTPDEFRSLASLDPGKLGITTEGYAGKRFERVDSAFPRTMRALEALEPRVRSRYLATTAFPAGEEAERATFLRFVALGGAWGDATGRFLQDLAAVEALVFEAPRPPGLPRYRYRPEATRPRRTPYVLRRRLRGPLGEALALPPPGIPPTYADAPVEVLVLRDGGRVILDDLAADAAELLAACDGTHTAEALAQRFGAAAEIRLQRWLRFWVVEDAASAP